VKARLVTAVIVALLILAVISWAAAFSFEPFGPGYLSSLAKLSATLGLVFIFLQFVYVSRIKAIEAGIGLDRMFRWHRLFGRIGLGLVLLHAALIIIDRVADLDQLFSSPFTLVGLAVLVGFSVTAALAVFYKKMGILYETWRNIHLFNYLLFPVVLIHVFFYTQPGSMLQYLWVSLAILFAAVAVYRMVRIITVKNNPYEVVDVRAEAEDITSLFFKGPAVDFKPGQFMFIQLLRGGSLSSPHPFTISNSPSREYLSITPKELGDFTSTIRDTRVGDQAFIDAPYGVFSFLNHDHDELVFIAGGIGITPFMSMLRYIHDQKLGRKVTLFWANRNEKQLCFSDEIEKMKEDLPGFQVILVMSDQPDWPGEKGFITGEVISRHLEETGKKGFFICGPPPMTRAVMGELGKLKVPASHIHKELFEL
jgi:predicted ferric reductase